MDRHPWEKDARRTVAGVDEAGRGPAAGPVVAAAVVFTHAPPEGLNDSKALSPAKRDALAAAIVDRAFVGVGVAEAPEIDAVNVLQASLSAMRRAVAALPSRPDLALVDGDQRPQLPCAVETVVGGDGVFACIAAASIIAKVTRDALMIRAAVDWPEYGFERHKGYVSAAHKTALQRLGPCPIHRRSFAPVARTLAR